MSLIILSCIINIADSVFSFPFPVSSDVFLIFVLLVFNIKKTLYITFFAIVLVDIM